MDFKTLQEKTKTLLAYVQPWTSEQLTFRPAPNSWSTLDVLDHLSKVEQNILNAIKLNLPHGQAIPLKDRIAGTFIKVPPGSKVHPDPTPHLPTITQRWTKAQNEMAELLTTLSPSQKQTGLFQHPVSGWMTISQTLDFLHAHLRHHEYQLATIKRALTPPASS
jgi:uncharacterized damage-inducible protein DinB